MSLKLFQYYLLTEDGRSHYVTNGIVSSRGIPTPLPQTPDGWQDTAFGWERNKTWHGVQRSFSKDLGFVMDGATIVRDAMYKTNVDRKMYLLVQKLTLSYGSSYKWLYQTIYKGELDMSEPKDMQSGDRVEVPIMEGGLHKLINANYSTQYRIEFDGDAVNTRFDGMELQESAKYNVPEDVPIEKSVYGTNFYLPASFINREGNLPYLAFLSASLQSAPALWADKLASDNYLLKAADNNAGTVTITITGRLKFTCTANDPANGFRARFLRSNQDTVNQNDYEIFSLTPTPNSYEYDVNETIPLQPGERLYLEGIYFGTSGTEVSIHFNASSDLKIAYSQTGRETWVKGFLRKDLFRKLLKKIAGDEEYAESTLLEDGDRVITSMEAIRGIDGAGITTSFSDFFTDADADLCAGMSIFDGPATTNLPPGHRVNLEAREDYYDDSDPIDLGEAKELKIYPAADMMASRIKVGWKEPQTEDVNGRYSFNATQQYTTPIKRLDGEYKIVSPYKADPFEIETARIGLDGKDSTDDKRDLDNVVLWVERSQADTTAEVTFFTTGSNIKLTDSIQMVAGQKIRITGSASNDGEYFVSAVTVVSTLSLQIVTLAATLVDEGPVTVTIEWLEGITYDLKRETYTNQGDPDDFGVPSPTTVFNVDLSPKRMLLRHGRWLASMLSKYETEKVQFQSGTRNTALKTVQASGTVRENSDVTVGSLGNKIFLPYLMAAVINGDNNLADLLAVGPNRCFSFTWSGVQYKGFNMKAAFAPNEMNQQEYLLLSTTDNGLTELIN